MFGRRNFHRGRRFLRFCLSRGVCVSSLHTLAALQMMSASPFNNAAWSGRKVQPPPSPSRYLPELISQPCFVLCPPYRITAVPKIAPLGWVRRCALRTKRFWRHKTAPTFAIVRCSRDSSLTTIGNPSATTANTIPGGRRRGRRRRRRGLCGSRRRAKLRPSFETVKRGISDADMQAVGSERHAVCYGRNPLLYTVVVQVMPWRFPWC